MRTWLIVIASLLGPCLAAQPEGRLEWEAPDSVEVGKAFDIVLKLRNARNELPQPQLPEGLSLLAGPSVSNMTSIVNGKMSSERSLSYRVRMDAPGSISLPPVQAGELRAAAHAITALSVLPRSAPAQKDAAKKYRPRKHRKSYRI